MWKRTYGRKEPVMNDLIKKAKERDADAFTELMQSQMQNMYKAARSLLSNQEDAADAISETILTCWEKIDQLREERYFRTWMTRILINKCNDIRNKKETHFFTDETPEVEVKEEGYSDLEWNEALGILDEKYRTVIVLYYVEGFKMSEIAEILDIPEATVRTRIARARKKMAEEYYPEVERRRLI
nr:sigma-70 family RNA polymerase sigma factor [Blautia coccoides]